MTTHQANFEAYNRLCAHLNGEMYMPPASISALLVQPASRETKSLAEIFDSEAAQSAPKNEGATKPLSKSKNLEIIGELLNFHPETSSQDEPGEPALLSASAASARKVRSLSEILNAENVSQYGAEGMPTAVLSTGCDFKFSGRILSVQ